MTQEQAKLKKFWMHMVEVGVEGWMGGGFSGDGNQR